MTLNSMPRWLAVAVAVTLLLTGCATSSPVEAEPPTADLMPASPVADRMLACLVDAGWDAERDWSGGVGVRNTPDSQADQLRAAMEHCGDESGWSGGLSSLNDEQLVELYEQEVEEFHCLQDLGYEPEEPPSLQTYLSTFMSGEQYYAVRSVIEGGISESLQSLVSKCPPPTWFLNLEGF